jgi:hypothetical protein
MRSTLFAFLALAAALPVFAQDTNLVVQGATGRSRLTTTISSDPEWFNKTINIDFRNATLEDAIKKVLDAAKVKLDKIDDQTKGNKNKLTLKLDAVNVRDALAAVARLYGAQAYVLSEDGKTTVELKTRTSEPIAPLRSFSPFPSMGGGFSSSGGGVSFGPGNVLVTGSTERYKDLPDKKISIQSKDGPILAVIQGICKQAGMDFEIEDDLLAKKTSFVSITMQGVSVGNALDNAAGWLGCGWKTEKKGDKVKVYFGTKYPGPGYRWSMGPNGAGQVFTTRSPSMPLLPDLPIIGNLFRTTPSLSKRVSLDKKNTDVRECFKELLKDADVSYALADDLPTDAKSFTFSNVPLSTALDMICESIEVGWSAEQGPDGKPIVRIGKRYRGRSRQSSLGERFTSGSIAPSYTRFQERVLGNPRIPINFLML